ncbi:MAG: galactose mutarotase [Anaeroplasmataceae bacterium]|nr:galactose mutarotase [Anaeroplasmataceae bacterium]
MNHQIKKIDDITLISLDNEKGMIVTLCTFGASIYDISVVDGNEKVESVVLTPYYFEDFLKSTDYFGKCIGRFSGRIDEGICRINGKEYHLDKNWKQMNALHGGKDGIAFQNFMYQVEEKEHQTNVIFTFVEKENQLPGDVCYSITYEILKNKNEIRLVFDAVSSKDTIVNLTNHVYFNLSGNLKQNILNHKLQLNCATYTRLNQNLIAEAIEPVNKVMDFRKLHTIGDYIYDPSLQNHMAKGYDHCWIKEEMNQEYIALLQDEVSKRRLKIYTSYPAIVCYAGCYPSTSLFTKEKIPINQYHSLCLECQFIPNGINMNHVEKAILKQNDRYHHYIRYQFELCEESENDQGRFEKEV